MICLRHAERVDQCGSTRRFLPWNFELPSDPCAAACSYAPEPDVMGAGFANSRRHFLRAAARTLAGAQFGIMGTAKANEGEPRQLAALARATEWLNSPPLSTTSLLGDDQAVVSITATG